MHKVIKILFHIISCIILAVIILPVALTLALQLSSVQNFAVRKATGIISDKLGTEVSIEKINIRFFSRVVVDGFKVDDFKGDTLLYVNNIQAGLHHTGIFGGDLTFGEVKLDGVRFLMNEDSDSTSNFKKIIERIKRKNPPEDRQPFRMRMGELTITDMFYRFHKLEIPDRGGSVNFQDIRVDRFDFEGSNILIVGDSVMVDIRKLALSEKSGYTIENFRGDVMVSGTGISINNLHINSTGSNVNMDHLVFSTESWEDYRDFVNAVEMDVALSDTRVDFRTIAYFVPTMTHMKLVLERLNGDVKGTVNNMSGNMYQAWTGNTRMAFGYGMKDITDFRNAWIDANIRYLETNAQDISHIISNITGKPLPEKAEGILERTGGLDLTARFTGKLDNFRSEGTLGTVGQGDITFELNTMPAGNATAFHYDIRLDAVNLGELLGVEKMGRLWLRSDVRGNITGSEITAGTTTTVDALSYNGYRYNDIGIRGDFRNRRFIGQVNSGDPNINFGFNGMIDLNDSIPRYDFFFRLANADLAKLNLNRRDSVSTLQFYLVASASGTTPDDLNGDIDLTEIIYANNFDTVQTARIHLTGRNSPSSKYLALNSDFADVEYRSRTSYAEMLENLRDMIRYYAPTLAPADHEHDEPTVVYANVNNYSLLNIDIKQADTLAGIFVPGLVIGEGTKVAFMFNPDIRELSLSAKSEYVEYGNNYISNIEINTRNEGDSLSLFFRADDIYASGFYMPNFSLIGGMRDNQLNAATRFTDTTRHMNALIGLSAVLGKDPVTEAPQATIRFTPSTITMGDRLWNIYARSIVADSSSVVFNNLRVEGEGQSLRVNGVMSREQTDTVHISLMNFDLEPITQLTSRAGYRVEGHTSGEVDIIAVRGDAMLYADIKFDSVHFNGVPTPPSTFTSVWDFQHEQAFFALTPTDNPSDTLLRGNYRPSTGRYYGEAKMHGLDLSLLDPLFDGIVRDTKGEANVDVKITGTKGDVRLNGEVLVPAFTTTIDYLNVAYSMQDVTVRFDDNVMTAVDVPVRDPRGNTAGLDLKVDMSNFRNISYDINVRPENLLVLNTDSQYNELFYGTIFASGNASITGGRRGVSMNITASTAGNSEFNFPLGDEASVGLSENIRFIDTRRYAPVETTGYLDRKRQIRERGRRSRNTRERGAMDIDMTINVLPNTLFRLIMDPVSGDVLQGRGNGTLRMRVNPVNDEFTMNGQYDIAEGSYVFSLQGIVRRTFTIEEGSFIRWANNPLDADLDVTAVYNVRTSLAPLLAGYRTSDQNYARTVPVDSRIHLSGKLMQPTVTFDVDVPTIDPETDNLLRNELSTEENISRQFISLIAFNSFVSSGSGTIGGVSSSGTAFDLLSSQLSNILSTDRYHIGFRYNTRTDYTSDEFVFDFSTPLFGDRFLLDIEGNYNTNNNSDASINNTNNLTGDFYLTWLLDRNGNLRLKGFTRTIDRFDENQGLQEGGVGIYYKEDFDNVGDIVRNFRDRFSNWGRKKRRKAAAAEVDSPQPLEGIEEAVPVPAFDPDQFRDTF